MKRTLLCLAAILLSASAITAQEAPAPGSPLALLAHENVQKELNLSDDQVRKVKGLAVAVKKGSVKVADAAATVKKALKAEQLARLKQISYQVRGGMALVDSDLATALDLTKKQQADIARIKADEDKKLRDFLAVARFRSAEAMQAHIRDHNKKTAQRMLDTLTDKQKKQFAKMQGKAFDTSGLDRPVG
jgi:hypothetical protein